MDIVTAKALVSVILVFGVALFTIASFQMGLSHIATDLKAGWKPRTAPSEAGKAE